MNKIITVKNLGVNLNGHKLLEDISFDLEEQEIAALIGPNGSGKSTLIKAILGLIPISSGSYQIKSARIGYVPQHLDFDQKFPLTVEELFLSKLSGGGMWGRGKLEQIEKYLELTGARHLAQRQLGKLSGGELQRVLIAMTLTDNPDLLILDEPLAGVDVSGEESIQDLLEKLHEKYRLTILMVSHDLEVVFKRATKVICINKKLICVGHPGEVLTTENLEKLYGKVKAFYHHHGEHSAE